MYLLTFTFLVIGMLGIYTQVLGVEAARLYQSQTGIAQSMITWHEAAVSLAGNVMNTTTTPIGITGCSLTAFASTWSFEPPPCKPGTNVASASAAVAMPTTTPWNYTYTFPTTPAAAITTYPNLPASYAVGTYQWKSVAYQPGGNYYYVITYVDPPTTAGGLISSATNQLGITQSDLYQQIANSAIPIAAYGYVTNPTYPTAPGTLNTFAVLPGLPGPISYTVPASIPNGALAIISAPSQCNGC